MSTIRFSLLSIALLTSLACSAVRSPAPTDATRAGVPIGVALTPAAEIPYAWAPHVDIEAAEPAAVVDLASLPTVAPDQERPPLDRQESDEHRRISRREEARLKAAALLLPPSPNIASLPTTPGPNAPVPGVGFESLNYDEVGTTMPPDPELAVGLTHIIAVVNFSFEIYHKTGTTAAGPTLFSSFFAGTPGYPGGVFDPVVLYDESQDRYILGTDANGSAFCIAATTGADPTATWYRYCFPVNVGGAFHDYPHIGVGEEAIFLGGNQFLGSFLEGRVWAVNKANLYSGAPLGTVPSESTGFDSAPWPADLHGWAQGTWPTGTDVHYIMTEVYDGCDHNVWTWTDPFGASSFTKGANLDLCTASGVTAGYPLDWPNPGGGTLQANDWRGQSTHYRNGRLWMANQAIACNPGGGSVDCARWAQIDPVANQILQAGVIASDGDYRTFGSVAVNACDDMAIGYSKGSNAIFPATWVSGRLSTDPPGQMQAEMVMKAGEGTYDCWDGAPHRWGDYTGMTIDPDGVTYWYLGQYSRNNSSSCDWATYIGSFAFPGCTGGGDIFDDDFESGDTTAWSSSSP